MPNIASIVRDLVTLSSGCLDRIYVNGFQPKLQTSGQLCFFLSEHRGNPIASPALFAPLRERFVKEIGRFVAREEIACVRFEQSQRKDGVVAGGVPPALRAIGGRGGARCSSRENSVLQGYEACRPNCELRLVPSAGVRESVLLLLLGSD